MDGHTDRSGSSPAANARVGELDGLATAFGTALDRPDVRGARRLVRDALDGGASPGRLYVGVVRPALAARQGAPRSPYARLAAGVGEAILADLVASLPALAANGTGRAAVLSCRTSGIESVDGAVAMDFLESDGWQVDQMSGAIGTVDEAQTRALSRDGVVELVVAVIAGPQDALRLASVCTRLRRVADPPVIILCDFSGAPGGAASRSLGADDVVGDPEQLRRSAAQRLPVQGRRRWGVRLRRSDRTLMLAPTGTLDLTSVGRLADVVLTRTGTFSRLVIDLRDVAAIDSAGLRELALWPERLPLIDTEFVSVAAAAPAPSAGADRVAGLRGVAGWQMVEQPPV